VDRPVRLQKRFTDEEVTIGMELRDLKTPAKGVTMVFYRGFGDLVAGPLMLEIGSITKIESRH